MATEWRARRSLMTGVNTERSELWILRSDGHLETRVLKVRRVMAVEVDVDDWSTEKANRLSNGQEWAMRCSRIASIPSGLLTLKSKWLIRAHASLDSNRAIKHCTGRALQSSIRRCLNPILEERPSRLESSKISQCAKSRCLIFGNLVSQEWKASLGSFPRLYLR